MNMFYLVCLICSEAKIMFSFLLLEKTTVEIILNKQSILNCLNNLFYLVTAH